jgi:hypothetical protein
MRMLLSLNSIIRSALMRKLTATLTAMSTAMCSENIGLRSAHYSCRNRLREISHVLFSNRVSLRASSCLASGPACVRPTTLR